jgi:5'-nucleotidase
VTSDSVRSRVRRSAMIFVSLGVVVGAPLAISSNQSASAVTIAGANSLTDKVSVSYAAGDDDKTTDIHVLAWNDFHGNLEPAAMNIYGKYAGGAAYLAKAVLAKQRQYKGQVATVTAGDNIGAAPLASALFHDEPAEIVSNFLGVDYMSVGNHEFDKGSAELLRMQNGGCNPVAGCTAGPYAQRENSKIKYTKKYKGADFQYLAANVISNATGETLFPSYGVKSFRATNGKKVSVGFIGEVLQATPTIVTPSGVAGLTFKEEAAEANKAVQALKAQGVKIPVLVIHQGGIQNATQTSTNNCAGSLAGSDIEVIAKKLDPAIKVIVSGHTHAEYRCTITTTASDGSTVTRLVTSAASFGRVFTDLTLTVDNATGELASASATNTVVENSLNADTKTSRIDDPSKADPDVATIVKQYVDAAAPLAKKVIGRIQGDLTRTPSPLGESTLGDVIADAQLAATAGPTTGNAKIALMNSGGIRQDMLVNNISDGQQPGEVTYNGAFTVQPFGNSLVTKTMTGDQIRRVLQQQYVGCGQTVAKIMQISSTMSYSANPAAATCAEKVGVIKVNGVVLNPTDSIRVTMNNFMATGGDGYTVFNEGTEVLGGAQDIDALVEYFKAAPEAGIAVPTLNRITPIAG